MSEEELLQKIKDESDRKDFIYKGHACRVLRMIPCGYLCGYVGITKASPLYGVDYCELYEDVSIHGGLTYSGKMSDSDKWWFGFDCAHYGDRLPLYSDGTGVYRDMDYVKNEVENLVEQLIKLEENKGGK